MHVVVWGFPGWWTHATGQRWVWFGQQAGY